MLLEETSTQTQIPWRRPQQNLRSFSSPLLITVLHCAQAFAKYDTGIVLRDSENKFIR